MDDKKAGSWIHGSGGWVGVVVVWTRRGGMGGPETQKPFAGFDAFLMHQVSTWRWLPSSGRWVVLQTGLSTASVQPSLASRFWV